MSGIEAAYSGLYAVAALSFRSARVSVINTKHVLQRRGRPERDRRLGFRSSDIGGLTGGGSPGASRELCPDGAQDRGPEPAGILVQNGFWVGGVLRLWPVELAKPKNYGSPLRSVLWRTDFPNGSGESGLGQHRDGAFTADLLRCYDCGSRPPALGRRAAAAMTVNVSVLRRWIQVAVGLYQHRCANKSCIVHSNCWCA